MTEEQLRQMNQEYDKGGKFKEFVDRACKIYKTTKEQEMQKLIVYEYYKSVLPDGCNRQS